MWLLLPSSHRILPRGDLVPPRAWRPLIARLIPMSSTALSGRGATPVFLAFPWVASAVLH